MRRLVVILIAALVVAVVVSLVFIAKGKANDQVVIFPNGVEVRVRGAYPGGKSVSSDKLWMATLRKILPARLQTKLPPVTSISCGSGSTNQLMVFFELTTTPWEWIAAVDDDGFVYPRSGGSCSSSIGNGQTLYGVHWKPFPGGKNRFAWTFSMHSQRWWLKSGWQIRCRCRRSNNHGRHKNYRLPKPMASWRSRWFR